MWKWIATKRRDLDAFGQQLRLFACVGSGVSIGALASHDFPASSWWICKFGLLFSLTVWWLAYFRSKPLLETKLDLRTR
jgi:hypothetical protein